MWLDRLGAALLEVVRSRLKISVFFFSSRRRHTRCSRDWSSDVCSSDLDNFAWLADRARQFDLVISSDGLPLELEGYLLEGGRVLAAGAAQPQIEIGKDRKSVV